QRADAGADADADNDNAELAKDDEDDEDEDENVDGVVDDDVDDDADERRLSRAEIDAAPIRCIVHALQLCIRDMFKLPGVLAITKKALVVIKAVRKSTRLQHRLRSLQEELGLPLRKLIAFIP